MIKTDDRSHCPSGSQSLLSEVGCEIGGGGGGRLAGGSWGPARSRGQPEGQQGLDRGTGQFRAAPLLCFLTWQRKKQLCMEPGSLFQPQDWPELICSLMKSRVDTFTLSLLYNLLSNECKSTSAPGPAEKPDASFTKMQGYCED